MTDKETPRKVFKNYNWKGMHTGYIDGASYIPASKDNSDFIRIEKEILSGECEAIEQEITLAYKVYSQKNKLTGFQTNIGFIPNDHKNLLFRKLQDAVDSNNLIIAEPEESRIEKVEFLTLCAPFQRPWENLKGSHEIKYPHKFSVQSSEIELVVRFKNIPENPSKISDLVFGLYNIECKARAPVIPLQAGVLEIEIPTKYLPKIFKSNRPYLDPIYEIILEEHLAQTDRNEPDLLWLVCYANCYLQFFVADVGNHLIRAFILEYGGLTPGYISASKNNQLFIFHHLENKEVQFGGLALLSSKSYNLEKIVSGSRFKGVAENSLGHKKYIPQRIDKMVEEGFVMEAILLLNSFLEVIIKEMFIQLNVSIPRHKDRIKMLKKLIGLSELDFYLAEPHFAETVNLIEKIYSHRNLYTHALKNPNDEKWISVKTEREILKMISAFTDAFEQRSRYTFVSRITNSVSIRKFLTQHKLIQMKKK